MKKYMQPAIYIANADMDPLMDDLTTGSGGPHITGTPAYVDDYEDEAENASNATIEWHASSMWE